jgi:hypothetical protein
MKSSPVAKEGRVVGEVTPPPPLYHELSAISNKNAVERYTSVRIFMAPILKFLLFTVS